MRKAELAKLNFSFLEQTLFIQNFENFFAFDLFNILIDS